MTLIDNNNKLLNTVSYLAGAIEILSTKEMSSWRNYVKEQFKDKDIFFYDPVFQESLKVDTSCGSHNKVLANLKKEGNYKEFLDHMWSIWAQNLPRTEPLVNILNHIRADKYLSGNTLEKMNRSADFEAVIRSDFIFVFLPKDTKTIGTIFEVCVAMLFNIPVYLVVPDDEKENINSSLLFAVQASHGRFFTSLDECINYIKRKYF